MTPFLQNLQTTQEREMTKVEEVARAIWDDREKHQHPRCRQTWEQGSELARRFAMDHARAAIEAYTGPALNPPPEQVGGPVQARDGGRG